MGGARAHIIVFGNEKGGSGKTTAAMHVAVALARLGKRIVLIDLDTRQKSLLRYVENRAQWSMKRGVDIPQLEGFSITQTIGVSLDANAQEQALEFEKVLSGVADRSDFVLIDTPGSDTPLSRRAHAEADTLVTPMNDSFVDFDLLARVDPATYKILGPSLYSNFVWDCRKKRLLARRPALDWVVMRNRISAHEAKNKRRLSSALNQLSERIGFRIAPGFGDRVIFRELFPVGLTMLDLPQRGVGISFSLSHVAARQEVRELLITLNLPGIGTETGIL
jgi:chromosome partitioning protein